MFEIQKEFEEKHEPQRAETSIWAYMHLSILCGILPLKFLTRMGEHCELSKAGFWTLRSNVQWRHFFFLASLLLHGEACCWTMFFNGLSWTLGLSGTQSDGPAGQILSAVFDLFPVNRTLLELCKMVGEERTIEIMLWVMTSMHLSWIWVFLLASGEYELDWAVEAWA